jgi:hypothetical protein
MALICSYSGLNEAIGSDIRDKLAPGQLMLDKIEAYFISYIRHD